MLEQNTLSLVLVIAAKIFLLQVYHLFIVQLELMLEMIYQNHLLNAIYVGRATIAQVH